MKAALYMRVSTRGHGQDTETQAIALREYASHRGFEIVEEYADRGFSGAKERRPALDRLMEDARAKKFDAVLVARFDRFARSTKHLITALEEFKALGISFASLAESVDTSTAMGEFFFTVLGAFAQLERNVIKERIATGLARAKKEKKILGRPKCIFNRQKAVELQSEGKSVRQIAAILSVGKSIVARALVRQAS
jgi:DNA invertase Pin-like site-specific DNA recombinase